MSGEDRSIVIGCEDSAEGRDAVALGVELAQALGARPLLVGAVALPDDLLTGAQLEEELRGAVGGWLERVAEGVRELGLEPQVRALASSSGARALYGAAVEAGAALIVVGSTHRGALGRAVAGSTGERLLHGSPCPVAVAARGYAEAGARRLLRLAVAYDGSDESELAVRAGVGLARRCNASLSLLTVAHSGGLGPSATAAPVPVAGYEPSAEKRMQRVLEQGIGRVPEDLPVQKQLLRGHPGTTLVEASADYDLIIVGSRGYGPLRSTLLGGTSRQVLDGARCSAMALPRGISADPFGATP